MPAMVGSRSSSASVSLIDVSLVSLVISVMLAGVAYEVPVDLAGVEAVLCSTGGVSELCVVRF